MHTPLVHKHAKLSHELYLISCKLYPFKEFLKDLFFLYSYLPKRTKFKPLYTGNSLTGTLIDSEFPGEMSQNVLFYQGLHCLLKQKSNYIFFLEIIIYDLCQLYIFILTK